MLTGEKLNDLNRGRESKQTED